MANSPPDLIDVAHAVRKEWELSGSMNLNEFERLPGHLLVLNETAVNYQIQFRYSSHLIGLADVKIKAKLQLICQRSLEHFEHLLTVDKTVGFIDDFGDEAKLEPNTAPSWVEDGLVSPKQLLEDELLLAIPDFPIKDGAEIQTDYLATTNDEPQTAEENKQNPFAVLKKLKTN